MNYLIVAAVLCILATWTQAAEGPSVLDVGPVRLGIDAKSGAIASIVHRSASRDFAASAAPGTLYVIELADPAGTVRSNEAANVRVAVAPDGALVIEARHEKPVAMTVTCRLTADADGGSALGRVSLRTDQPVALASVTFPALSVGLPMSGSGADDAVLLPECDGAIVVDPLKNGVWRDMAYPGGASMQCMAAYDKAAGVYVASRDGDGHAKVLSAKRRDKALELSIRHILPRTPVTQWSLPYDVAITTFGIEGKSGWETAADLYRPWALQQKWCSKTLKERVTSGDVPAWLVEPSLFYAFSLHGRLPDGKDGARISLVPAHADAWRDVIGGPVTFMLMSWEKQGPWVAPDYFPPIGDGNAFTAATRALHEKGHRTLVFLSGLNWTLHKTARGNYPAIADQAAFDQRGRAHAIADAKGDASIYGKPAEDVGQYARICPTTPLADGMIAGAVAKCQDIGLDCVQADQIVGGGSPACFSSKHSHEPGGGNWSARALYGLFERARTQGKARTRDFAFSIEEPGEFFIPVLDTYHARDYQQNRWPRYGQGVVGVPLFTHVYHDYLHGYGGDSAAVTSAQNDVALYHQAMNLICGKAPAVCKWSDWIDPATVDPAQKRMLRSHFDLWRGPAHEFLLFGKRVTSADPATPTMEITFTDWPSRKQSTLRVPGVLQGVWELPDGKRARILACIAREAITLDIDGRSVRLEPGETDFRAIPAR